MTSISSKAALAASAFAVLAAGAAQAATRFVDVGPGAKALPKNRTYDANAFLPGTVTVHVGDKVKVVAKGKKIPSQASVAKQAKKELAGIAAKAKAADKAGQSAPNTIQAGADGKASSTTRTTRPTRPSRSTRP